MEKTVAAKSASALIDERIRELGDWRGKTLAKVRDIIHQADPEIVEEGQCVKPTRQMRSSVGSRRVFAYVNANSMACDSGGTRRRSTAGLTSRRAVMKHSRSRSTGRSSNATCNRVN